MATSFWSLPMTSGGQDMPVGVDELGNTVMETVDGVRYVVKTQAPQRESYARAALDAVRSDPAGTLRNAFVGAAQGAWDAVATPGRSWSDTVTYGDVANTAGLVSLPAVAGKYDPAVANMGIRAYHGSPHDFDRFDLSKIGTGEGAQAYGHGLYFAEAEDVAKEYRKALARSNELTKNPTFGGMSIGAYRTRMELAGDDGAAEAAQQLRDFILTEPGVRSGLQYDGKTLDDVVPDLRRRLISQKAQAPETLAEWYDNVISGLDRALRDIDRPDYRAGRMYEVDINADPADFLDWDAPLSEQPAKVQKLAGISPDDKLRLQSIIDEMEAMGRDRLPNNQMREEKRWFALARERDALAEKVRAGKRGDHLYNYLTDPNRSGQVGLVAEHQSRQRATDIMREAGIPGIKYYDQGSRAGKEGTRNYVVFDDSLIDIIRKYGWAAVAPLMAANGSDHAQY